MFHLDVDNVFFGVVCLFPFVIYFAYGLTLTELKHVFAAMFVFSTLMSIWPHDIKRAYPWMFLCLVTLVLGIFLPE